MTKKQPSFYASFTEKCKILLLLFRSVATCANKEHRKKNRAKFLGISEKRWICCREKQGNKIRKKLVVLYEKSKIPG
jgi:hypothetical protein